MKAKSNCRLRKVSCPDCGYTIRMARSWMERGLPACPCGTAMRPVAGADLAWIGLIGQDDVPRRVWTEICRENGWEDSIVRTGAAAKYLRVPKNGKTRPARRVRPADFCAYPGCGRFVAAGAEHCTAGHAQHEHAEPMAEAMPF